jgi:hypothetical protein
MTLAQYSIELLQYKLVMVPAAPQATTGDHSSNADDYKNHSTKF